MEAGRPSPRRAARLARRARPAAARRAPRPRAGRLDGRDGVILGENGPVTRIEKFGLAVALLLALALMWPVRGYLTDDTFIHLQYARNVATGRGFVFNAGEPVYGSTSPLWVALIADGMTLGFDGLRTA